MERQEVIKTEILHGALESASDMGWSDALLRRASIDAGYSANMGSLVFMDGVVGVLYMLHLRLDQEMLDCAANGLGALRVHEKIYNLLCCRFQAAEKHKAAIVRGMHFLAMPHNIVYATRITARTVDAIWSAASHNDADYNYYTKRTILAGVYVASLLHWSSGDADLESTYRFISKRLEDAAVLGKIVRKIKH